MKLGCPVVVVVPVEVPIGRPGFPVSVVVLVVVPVVPVVVPVEPGTKTPGREALVPRDVPVEVLAEVADESDPLDDERRVGNAPPMVGRVSDRLGRVLLEPVIDDDDAEDIEDVDWTEVVVDRREDPDPPPISTGRIWVDAVLRTCVPPLGPNWNPIVGLLARPNRMCLMHPRERPRYVIVIVFGECLRGVRKSLRIIALRDRNSALFISQRRCTPEIGSGQETTRATRA